MNISALSSPKGTIKGSQKENFATELSDTKTANLAELLGRNKPLNSTRNNSKPIRVNPFLQTTISSTRFDALSHRDNSSGDAGEEFSLSQRIQHNKLQNK